MTTGDRASGDGYPAFEEAASQLRALLSAQGWPRDIHWLTGQRVFGDHRHIVIRVGGSDSLSRIAEAYRAAVGRSFGVLLYGVARDRQRSYCALWAPATREQAARLLMPDGLKLSLTAHPPGISLLGPFLFAVARLTSRRRNRSPLLGNDD